MCRTVQRSVIVHEPAQIAHSGLGSAGAPRPCLVARRMTPLSADHPREPGKPLSQLLTTRVGMRKPSLDDQRVSSSDVFETNMVVKPSTMSISRAYEFVPSAQS